MSPCWSLLAPLQGPLSQAEVAVDAGLQQVSPWRSAAAREDSGSGNSILKDMKPSSEGENWKIRVIPHVGPMLSAQAGTAGLLSLVHGELAREVTAGPGSGLQLLE